MPYGSITPVRRCRRPGSGRRLPDKDTTRHLAPARPAIPGSAGQRPERRRRGVTGTYASISQKGRPIVFARSHGTAMGCGPNRHSMRFGPAAAESLSYASSCPSNTSTCSRPAPSIFTGVTTGG